jgi:hypothetical protein
MMRYLKTVLFFSLLLFSAISCKKKNASTTTAITDLKGKVTLHIKVSHHSLLLANQKVYLKLAATSYPSNNTSLYNYSTTTNTSGEAIFYQLPMGSIWLYSTGYDPSEGKDVSGNTGFNISSSTVDANYNAYTDVLVSE